MEEDLRRRGRPSRPRDYPPRVAAPDEPEEGSVASPGGLSLPFPGGGMGLECVSVCMRVHVRWRDQV